MVAAGHKLAEAVGSAAPDGLKGQAAITPLPPPAVENKTAPGQTGPKGLSPRTTYSRVNTARPPTPDTGTSAKTGPNGGLALLPAKTAKVNMSTLGRPELNDLVKAAMAGTMQRVAAGIEADMQLGVAPQTKVANASTHIPTEQAAKLASALAYLAGEFEKDAEESTGPNALPASAATASEPNIDTGEGGQASGANQQPKTTSTAALGTLPDNAAMQHPEQPVEPIANQKVAQLHNNTVRLQQMLGKQAAAGGAGVTVAEIRQRQKVAEDAINPAQISAGTVPNGPPEGASASEENVPAVPSDVSSQEQMVASNQAAIDFTKRDAKADPKKDVDQLLSENAQTAATDKTLERVFDRTGEAGAKIASMQQGGIKTAAARVLLSSLVKAAACADPKEMKKAKEKDGQGMAPATPQQASGFTASSM